jgi:hypothetical protein
LQRTESPSTVRGVAGGLSDQPPFGGNDLVSSPVLSLKASSASHAGTFPGLSGMFHPLLVAFRGRHQAHPRPRGGRG